MKSVNNFLRASLLLTSMSSIAGERNNGGDPLLINFTEGLEIAKLILEESLPQDWVIPESIPQQVIDRGMDSKSLENWIEINHTNLYEDLKKIVVRLNDSTTPSPDAASAILNSSKLSAQEEEVEEKEASEQSTCAKTSEKPGDVVWISVKACGDKVASSLDAAWVLIGEAVHHVDSHSRAGWSQDDENIFAALVSATARRSFSEFKLSPIRMVRKHPCSTKSLIGEQLRSAVEGLNYSLVKKIVEDGYQLEMGIVDRDCHLVSTVTAIAAATLSDLHSRLDSKSAPAFNILKFIIENKGGWDIQKTEPALKQITKVFNKDLVRRLGSLTDSIMEFFFTGSAESGFDSNIFAVYSLGYSRQSLQAMTAENASRFDFQEIIANLINGNYPNLDSAFELGKIAGLELSQPWFLEKVKESLNLYSIRPVARQLVTKWNEEGLKFSEVDQQQVLSNMVHSLNMANFYNGNELESFKNFLNLAEIADISLGLSLGWKGAETLNLADWISIFAELNKTGKEIHQILRDHRVKIADYAGNRGVYRNPREVERLGKDAQLMAERSAVLHKLSTILLAKGVKPSKGCAYFIVPKIERVIDSHSMTYGVNTFLLLAMQQAGTDHEIQGPYLDSYGHLRWPPNPDKFKSHKNVRFETIELCHK